MDLFEKLAALTKPSSLNKETASMIVMSHLSDAQFEINIANDGAKDTANNRLNFVKYIILKLGGDLTKEINPDELWNEYKSR